MAFTIAERLYYSHPDILFKIIVMFQLERLARTYFPANLIDANEDTHIAYAKLMRPGEYSGRIERRNGAIMQPHRTVIR